MSKKKHQENEKPKVNPELKGLEVSINEFGEIITSYDAEDINSFLDKELYDKKIGNTEAKSGSLKEKHSKRTKPKN